MDQQRSGNFVRTGIHGPIRASLALLLWFRTFTCRSRRRFLWEDRRTRGQHGGTRVGREARHRLYGGVQDLQSAGSCIRPLEEIGYSYWTENPNLKRMLFVKFTDADRTSRLHNMHIVEAGGDLWNEMLLFRDYLRSHHEAAVEYARLKHALGERFRDDREA